MGFREIVKFIADLLSLMPHLQSWVVELVRCLPGGGLDETIHMAYPALLVCFGLTSKITGTRHGMGISQLGQVAWQANHHSFIIKTLGSSQIKLVFPLAWRCLCLHRM